jgi:hypothetical protein
VSLGTRLESKSSDLDVFEPGGSATATFPNLKIWTPADTFIVPENLCFSTYDPQRFSEMVIKRIQEYFAEFAPIVNDQLVFIDEMGATLNLETDYGRSQRGQGAVGSKPTASGHESVLLGHCPRRVWRQSGVLKGS